MRKSVPIAVMTILTAGLLLSGCGREGGNILGFEKNAPDEFAVVKRAPLALPPDYGLRPPRPGAPRPQEEDARQAAQNSLIGATPAPERQTRRDARAIRAERVAGRSAGEVALLTRTGALDVDPSIRQVINSETVGAVDDVEESFVDKLLFWRDKKEVTGTSDYAIIDATREKQRLRENESLGKPVTAGKTPTIKRKEGSLLF
jgi:hypothetical protein